MATYEQQVDALRTSDPRPLPRRDSARNSTAMTASAINLLIGAWLFVSYWILDYTASDPGWLALVFGPAIALFALLRLSGVGLSWLGSVANMAIGVWLAIAAFAVAESNVITTNLLASGAMLFVLATLAASVRSARML